jgi:hypothetical protein
MRLWETAEREPEAVGARSEAPKRGRDTLPGFCAGMVRETLEDFATEERDRIYKLFRLGIRFLQTGRRLLGGGGKRAGGDPSPCKRSPLGV